MKYRLVPGLYTTWLTWTLWQLSNNGCHFFNNNGGLVVEGYISLQTVPRGRQVEWLKQMTADLTHVELGHLSEDQLSTAPDIMYAWSLTPVKSTEKALALESLVKRLVDERRAGNELVSDLTVQDYNCLLEGWARSGAGEVAAERCEGILERMESEGGLVKPDLASYKAVLMAWRQAIQETPHGAHRAQRILERMIRLYQENPVGYRNILPDADCFDCVLQIWSRSGHTNAPEQAEVVLAAMERLYESTGLVELKPRTTSFNAVLATWSRSSRPQAVERAWDLLGFMELLQERGDEMVAPDKASYCTVMGVLAKQYPKNGAVENAVDIAQKAELLLERAEKQYERHQQMKKMSKGRKKSSALLSSTFVPDAILFNTAMGCWAKTNEPGSYRYAQSILDRQIQLFKSGCDECQPDVFGYTSVIASAASAQGNFEERREAFQVALDTYHRMLEDDNDVSPNHVTYGNLLKACSRLLAPKSKLRRKWTLRWFQECRDAGYVGDMVLSRLRESTRNAEFKELLEGHSRKQVPKSWTRNLPSNVQRNERQQRLARPSTSTSSRRRNNQQQRRRQPRKSAEV